jgi:K+-sensing histidine kinase KdpD
VAASGAALGLGFASSTSTHPHPLLLALVAVMLATCAGGLGPGLVATVVGTLGFAYLLPPAGTLRIALRSDVVILGLYCTMAALSVLLLDYVSRRAAQQPPRA